VLSHFGNRDIAPADFPLAGFSFGAPRETCAMLPQMLSEIVSFLPSN
jgi:hypothetical protein